MKHITCNANQLKIHSVDVQTEHNKTEQSFKASDISYDEKAQKATFQFDNDLPVASHASLVVKFQGTMNNVSHNQM